MPKVTNKIVTAAQMIRERILRGDHILHGFPAERQLAEQLNISRQTLRPALSLLEEEGFLERKSNGRLEVVSEGGAAPKPKKLIGFVRPPNISYDFEMWKHAVSNAFEGMDVTVRMMTYEHDDDSWLLSSLNAFDGMFFIPVGGKLSKWMVKKVQSARCKVVILDQDASDCGLPSIVGFARGSEVRLLEHLAELGHGSIDCLNTQDRDYVIEGRIQTWQGFLQRRKLSGNLVSFNAFVPLESAYQIIRNRITEGKPVASSLFCTTGPAAIGAMRAFHEAGIQVGRDVSVCAVNDEGMARFLIPSLTCLQSPPRALYIRRAVEWMMGEGTWQGGLYVEPEDAHLFVGESSGPPPRTAKEVRASFAQINSGLPPSNDT